MSLNKRLISGEAPAPGPAGFRALGFTGNGGSQTVSGMGFHPDIVWIKDRDTAYQHNIYFNSGGTGAAGWALEPSGTSSKYSLSGLTGFNSDGFVLGSNAGNNQGSSPNVAYGWKVSDTVDDFNTNTTGSIDASYQLVSDTRGMSTFTYTGTGSAGTLGHGLSAAPEVVLIKTASHTSDWPMYHKDLTDASYRMVFNTTAAENTDNNPWNSTDPTSSVISIGNSGNTIQSGRTFICWAMHSVDKFSKFGQYTGNGSTTGPTVTLGFKPAFLLIRRQDSADNGYIFDSARHGDDNNNLALIPNSNVAESVGNLGDGYDFLSNGFQVVSSDSGVNANNGKYVYMAFADNGD